MRDRTRARVENLRPRTQVSWGVWVLHEGAREGGHDREMGVREIGRRPTTGRGGGWSGRATGEQRLARLGEFWLGTGRRSVNSERCRIGGREMANWGDGVWMRCEASSGLNSAGKEFFAERLRSAEMDLARRHRGCGKPENSWGCEFGRESVNSEQANSAVWLGEFGSGQVNSARK